MYWFQITKADIARANEMNICKFVADELHESLSNGKYTKGCLLYCMLRYFDALETNHLELEIGDAPFAINAWSKLAIDAVGALDTQEYDTTTSGAMQLKDEYKEEFATGMALFGGPDGFDAWMRINTHPTCTKKQRIKASTLMQSCASGLNGLLSTLVQGLTTMSESDLDTEASDDEGTDDEVEEHEDIELSAHETDQEEGRGLPAATKKVGRRIPHSVKEVAPTDKEVQGNEIVPVYPDASNSVAPSSAGAFVSSPGGNTSAVASPCHTKADETNSIIALANTKDASYSESPPAMHSQIMIPSFSDLDTSDCINEAGCGPDSPLECTRRDDEMIKGSAAGLAAVLSKRKKHTIGTSSEASAHTKTNNAIAIELTIPIGLGENKSTEHHVLDIIHESDKVDSECNATGHDADSVIKGNSIEGITIHPVGVKSFEVEKAVHDSRKRLRIPSITPSRKSPRLASIYGVSNSEIPTEGTKSVDVAVDGVGSRDSIGVFMQASSQVDGKSLRTAIVLSPTVGTTNTQNMSSGGVADGKTLSTAIAISPSVASMTPATIALTSSNESKRSLSSDGKCKDIAIAISPTITEQQQLNPSAEGNLCKPITTSADANKSRKPWALSPQVKARLGILGLQRGSPASVSPEVAEAIRKFSESVVKSGFLSRFAANESSTAGDGSRKRKHMNEGTSSSGATRDNRAGMFTPPGFDLEISSLDTVVSDSQEEEFSSQEDAVPKFIAPIAPLDWAGPSEEVQAVIAGDVVQLSENGMAELARYEELSKAFIARQKALQIAAAPSLSLGASNMHSVTPKVHPRKVRVKKSSHFMQSPFDSSIKVSPEQEEIYQKLMLSNKHQRPVKSQIRMYQIIKYHDSFTTTSDLANSIHGRGELSNHCMEVGIEYLRRTNTLAGKVIVPYQVYVYLLNGEFQKKAVVSMFKRTENYSLSVMKQISFPVLEEVQKANKEGNHWYCLSMNFQDERFEALDSMRSQGNELLVSHATHLINNIKALWEIHYSTSKVQIKNWELKIIDVPIQANIFDCGFHAIYNVDKWDGQKVPALAKDDVLKLRRIYPYRWLTADFNEEKDRWRYNLFNNVIR
ncbi:hypothetical protein ACQ4PT_038044 [Festuca glaucescens]